MAALIVRGYVVALQTGEIFIEAPAGISIDELEQIRTVIPRLGRGSAADPPSEMENQRGRPMFILGAWRAAYPDRRDSWDEIEFVARRSEV
jgi:hypothetical protein